uniref:Uncharacterized protein n=1 Tax=Anopheles farauti TaxID=69004 RepID=A0A182QLR0_9DIPT
MKTTRRFKQPSHASERTVSRVDRGLAAMPRECDRYVVKNGNRSHRGSSWTSSIWGSFNRITSIDESSVYKLLAVGFDEDDTIGIPMMRMQPRVALMVAELLMVLRLMVMLLLLLLLLLHVVMRRTGCTGRRPGGAASSTARVFLLLDALLEVHLRVTLLLVRSGELSAADVTRERFLARVRPDVRRQVVRPAERAHADPTLERLLAGVDADVAGQLVRAGEPPVAVLDRARVRSLVDGRLARAVRVLARFHRHQLERHRALLVHLRQDLVALARRLIVLGQLDGVLRLLGGLRRRQPTELARIGRARVRCRVRFLLRNDRPDRDRRGGRPGQDTGRCVLRTAHVRIDRRVEPLVLLAHARQPLLAPLPTVRMHLLALLHVHRTNAAPVARRLLQDDARAVHVQPEQLRLAGGVASVTPFLPTVVVLLLLLLLVLMLPDRGRSRHALRGTGGLRSEQAEHRRLEQAFEILFSIASDDDDDWTPPSAVPPCCISAVLPPVTLAKPATRICPCRGGFLTHHTLEIPDLPNVNVNRSATRPFTDGRYGANINFERCQRFLMPAVRVSNEI